MTWFDNIESLQFYNPPKFGPCYCEVLIYPTDLLLQGFFTPYGGSYGLNVQAYSPNGQSLIEDISSYFDVYYGAFNGLHFFNARMNGWPPSVCAEPCFVLRVTVTAVDGTYGVILFDKYTERFCQSECCDQARDITIGGEPQPSTFSQGSRPYTECGEPLIRLISKHDCYDPVANVFYGIPGNVVQGVADFPFEKISTFKGRIVRRPQEITRELSYNCKLQRVTTIPQYFFEGREYFPTWKMLEINAQFGAKEIYVDDYNTNKQYQYAGGNPFRQLSNCAELFKLETTLQDCEIRQVYGCDTTCGTPSLLQGYQSFFIIPSNYNGSGFYNDNRELVATSIDELIDYIRTRDGMTGAGSLTFSPALGCDYTAVIGFSGEGYLPSSIYYNNTSPGNRIYAVGIETASEVCDLVTPVCATPIAGPVEITNTECATPIAGTITYEANTGDEVTIQQQMPWEITSQSGSVTAGQVNFYLEAHNYSIIPIPGEEIYLTDQVIGVMYANARPAMTVYMDSTNNSLPAGWVISVDTAGVIRFSGEPIANVGSDVEVSFTNIVYNI